MSKSTWALFVLLAVLAIGAIAVATQFRRKLISPAGQRLASENRLRIVIAGLRVYRDAEGAWPERLAQPISSGRLTLASCAGVIYRRPSANAVADTVVAWRETILPGVRRGEQWSGPEDRATHDIPAVGFVATLDGRVERVAPEEFVRRTTGATVAP